MNCHDQNKELREFIARIDQLTPAQLQDVADKLKNIHGLSMDYLLEGIQRIRETLAKTQE